MKALNVLLVRAAGFPIRSVPYGLLYMQAVLREAGMRAELLDREEHAEWEELDRQLDTLHPDAVGISAMTAQFSDARDVIGHIRRRQEPAPRIIVGGYHASALPQEALAAGADNVVVGEAEFSLRAFLRSPADFGPVIKAEPVTDLDQLPDIAMQDIGPFVKRSGGGGEKGFYVLTGRGCPYSCNFCLGKEQRVPGVRFHALNRVVSFMSRLHQSFGLDYFFIADDIFVLNPARVNEFCDRVETDLPRGVRFHCFSHAGHGSRDLYRRMKQCGFCRISLGAEHGNDRILSLMGKKATRRSIERTCAEIHEAGIELNLTYVLGNVHETDRTVSETIDFAIRLHRKFGASSWFSYLQPLPGSPVYTRAAACGTLLPGRSSFQNTELCFIPRDCSAEHLVRERRRGMEQANCPVTRR